MAWNDVLATVEAFADVTEFSVEACADLFGCEFEEVARDHYRARHCDSSFAAVDLRLGERSEQITLTLDPSADLAGFAEAAKRLGPGVDVDIVSPPPFDPERPDSRPPWDRKYSVCHVIGGRQVWLGFEETDGVERLVTISSG